MRLRDFLDDGRDGASLVMSRKGRASRLVAMVVMAALLGVVFNAKASVVWIAANAGLELWLFWLMRGMRSRGGKPLSLAARLAPAMTFSAVWSVTALVSWVYGPQVVRFAAMLVLLGMIVEGLKYAAFSRTATVSLLPFPVLAMSALPFFVGKPLWMESLAAGTALVCLGGYLIDASRMLRANAMALEKAQAEALDASRAKSDFLAMMSHELRTPMNGVLGLAHALRGTRLDKRQAEYLEMIEQSGDGLMTILNDILDLSKIEAGKLELEVAPFDVRKLAAQIRLFWSETARLKGLDLLLDVDPATPQWLAGDVARVRQILMNLVSNALKFTEAGQVTVRIAPHADGVVLAVSDTGVGMSDEQRARLFTPFVQGDRTISRRFGGTGLGLAICRQLVETMGGEIGVESVPGEGSTFTARLVLATTQAPGTLADAAQAMNLSGMRVLVVDDNAVNQLVARAILEAADASVATVGDGHTALARLRIEDFDVVLMDVHMPGMDGVEAVRRIRAGEGGRVDLPVVALTADAMIGDAERLLSQGFDDAHPKPIQPAGLLATVAGLRWTTPQVPLRKSA